MMWVRFPSGAFLSADYVSNYKISTFFNFQLDKIDTDVMLFGYDFQSTVHAFYSCPTPVWQKGLVLSDSKRP